MLTTDCGVETDDQWAVAYLALLAEAGEVDLRAIVATHAARHTTPEAAAASVRGVLESLRLEHPPPVLRGAPEPVAADRRPRGGAAARAIVKTALALPAGQRLTVLSIGTATDVAEALLLEPAVAESLEVVAMAFDGWPQGGDPFNVKNDPLAFAVLLDSDVPLTVGAADVCVRHLILDRPAAAALTSAGSVAGRRLQKSFDDWLARELCRQYTGRAAWPLWDLVTVAYLRRQTASEERPRPRLRDDLTFDHDRARGTIRWITAVDERELWEDFRRRIAADARTPRTSELKEVRP